MAFEHGVEAFSSFLAEALEAGFVERQVGEEGAVLVSLGEGELRAESLFHAWVVEFGQLAVNGGGFEFHGAAATPEQPAVGDYIVGFVLVDGLVFGEHRGKVRMVAFLGFVVEEDVGDEKAGLGAEPVFEGVLG